MIFVVVLMMQITCFLLDVYPAGEEPLKGFESTGFKKWTFK